MTHNSIAYYQAQQQEVANLEQARSNRAKEAISDFEAKSNDRYRTGMLAINKIQAEEAARHNASMEALQSRLNEINSARNAQMAYHEQRLANIQQQNADTTAWKAQKEVESQKRRDAYQYLGLSETHRHNVESENLSSQKNKNDIYLGVAGNLTRLAGTAANVFTTLLGLSVSQKAQRS